MSFITDIWNILKEVWKWVWPIYVIKEFQGGVVLRNGIYRRTPKKGLNFKLPLLDEVIKVNTVPETITVSSQSLITKDAHDIVVDSVIKYKVTDTRKYCLEAYDVVDAIPDIVQRTIKNVIIHKSFDECRTQDIDTEITSEVRKEASKWGLKIDYVTLTTIAKIKTIRLIQGS